VRQLTSPTEPDEALGLAEQAGEVAPGDLERSRPRRWTPCWAQAQIAARHALWVEVLAVCLLYALYDSGRGLAVSRAATAIRDAQLVARVERELHVFVEPEVQRALAHAHWLTTFFGIGYASFQLGITGLVLLWLYWWHPNVFPRVRTLLIVTSLLALVGFVLFPAAPPRLAGVGISDTLHIARATAESGVLAFLYNPYAAVPSLHESYAVIAGGSVALFAGRRLVRAIGVLYPLYTAVEVVATGNHFLFDIATGAAAVGVALLLTIPLASVGADRRIGRTLVLIAGRGREVVRPAPLRGSGDRQRVA